MNLSFDFAVLPLEPTWPTPAVENPRQIALSYVRQLLERGYTEKEAAAEFHLGVDGPGAGYVIRSGKILVPAFGPSRYEFRFEELADDIRADTSSVPHSEKS